MPFVREWFRGPPKVVAEGGKRPVELVMSIPPGFAEGFHRRIHGVRSTHEELMSLFGSAHRGIKIFSPYVDPTFTGLLQLAKVPVWVVTTMREGRTGRASSVLERCAAYRDVVVRYVVERRNKSQMFQMHAKMILVDSRVAYVGSANLTDTSIHYNLELGLRVEDPVVVERLERVFDFVMEVLSVPAKMI